ncbi:hypothetical protein [Sinorhizobium meliloti]|uniref:hypothetical protein n=1 Tax=Rhizobium meliloti TaxID=382 RepID=UPI000FD745E5|nr:hypothetical protein [Sinorhizobium meliloti]RVG88684.1 hypothetical protein CN219_03700 [Sinorhizobium meliloti]RVI39034.1 hypothetical protein CN197_02535 [Sinorhizobium meliloti]RVI46669.1 hypothetical protein CN196_09385 [Sinorhizobium meliloti]RVJ25671.1 hypothetical protein CN177_13425 [Sinorhizobium meliloti]RVK02250.1 hypothetical protein CN170_08705 [Sinorhizobium meliloti]
MPVGTPVLATAAVGATATSATTASFTPAAGDLLLAFAAARAAAAEIPTISDTLGNTWTQVDTSGTDFSNITAKLWYQVVEGSPAARTVTASSTGSTQVGLAIVSISGAGTDFSNFQIGTNGAGDPSVTMAAYAASSIALGFYAGNAGGSNPTIPTGYTSLSNSQIATNIRFAVAHDTTSPSTSMAWVGPSTDSICFGVEVKEAAAAGAHTLTANTAAVTLAGTSATLRVARKLAANAAGVTLTGSAATLRRGFALTANSRAASLTGASTSLRAARKLTANTNSVSLTGASATLTYTPAPTGYVLTANTAAISLSGASAALKLSRVVQAGTSPLSVQGQTATLWVSRLLSCSVASISLTGAAADLTYTPSTGDRVLTASAASITLTGSVANLIAGVAPPETRTVDVRDEDRLIAVLPEYRRASAVREDRTTAVEIENRAAAVEGETRILSVRAEARQEAA